MRMILLILLLAPSRPLAAATLDDLPVNQWVKLETKREAGYTYSQPIYVPSRGQVLHWGAVRGGDYRPWMRNDVRAFDAEGLAWVSDYPRAEKLPGLITHSSHGKGISHGGTGEMLPCGTPAPSMIVNGVCYDSRRDQVVYTMKGLMAAYDPKARKWRDMKAKTLLYGKGYPGGPPVYGVGTCYDPVNDEIVLFPHWGGKNTDLRDVTGQMSAHCGTFIYRFADNTWRRVGHTFGRDETRKARKDVLERMARLSGLLDEAWVLRRHPDPEKEAELLKKLEPFLPVEGMLSMPAYRGKKFETALKHSLLTLRLFEVVLGKGSGLEPSPRCGTPMVYDPKNKVIVMFGGHSGLVRTDLGPAAHHGGRPGSLNDTWLYDVHTKQWRELKCERRPPPTLWPKMAYDPASGLVLLVTRSYPWTKREQRVIAIWGLNVAKGKWTKLHEQAWTWSYSDAYATGWRPDPFEVALDEKHGLLLLTQNVSQEKAPVEQVFAFRLDAGRLKPSPAPEWQEPPPIKPIEIPPEDPAWVAKLKSLPPNKWIHAKPPREAAPRGWGMAACDPVRGWVVYFGGGHATYQVNNPDIYVVGANRWVTTAGDHNDWVPPVGWGGVAMGLRGGRHAHHQRNEYVALDGRMFWSIGTGSRRWRAEEEKRPGPRFAWFYDIDRGGVWRQLRIHRVEMGEGVPGTYGKPCVVFPDGRVVGFGGALEPYDGRFFEGENYVAIYDIYKNTLAMKKIPPPCPGIVYECRPFCALPDRNQVFFYECVARKSKIQRQRTWVYDIASNRFIDLRPKRQPTVADEPGTVECLEGQDAVFAAIGRDQQWVYSFQRNTWAPLPLQSDSKFGFDRVYTQLVYVAKYGILVSVGAASRGTAVMRPEVSTIH